MSRTIDEPASSDEHDKPGRIKPVSGAELEPPSAEEQAFMAAHTVYELKILAAFIESRTGRRASGGAS